MKEKEKDVFLEEIDNELRTLNKRLKNVMSEANALLSEHFGETMEGSNTSSDSGESTEDVGDNGLE